MKHFPPKDKNNFLLSNLNMLCGSLLIFSQLTFLLRLTSISFVREIPAKAIKLRHAIYQLIEGQINKTVVTIWHFFICAIFVQNMRNCVPKCQFLYYRSRTLFSSANPRKQLPKLCQRYVSSVSDKREYFLTTPIFYVNAGKSNVLLT